MDKMTEFEEAELRHEFRQLYRECGMTQALEELCSMLSVANILLMVIFEEYTKDHDTPIK